MVEFEDPYADEPSADFPKDFTEEEARETIKTFFETHTKQVFFTRQIEVQNEKLFFHWVTN